MFSQCDFGRLWVKALVTFQVWEGRWRVIPFHVLPEWLKDNDYLLHGHRPPMPSFRACFGSIFRIHTETGNIWTHLLGESKRPYITLVTWLSIDFWQHILLWFKARHIGWAHILFLKNPEWFWFILMLAITETVVSSSLGLILFICLGTLTMLRPNMYFMAPLQEKVVFGMFFLGAVLCLSFSWLFHTVYCHSEKVSRTFSK